MGFEKCSYIKVCQIGDLYTRIEALDVQTARYYPQKVYWVSIKIASLLKLQWKQGLIIYFCISRSYYCQNQVIIKIKQQMIKVLGKKKEYKYLQSLGIEYKIESKTNYSRNKYSLKRLVSRTEILSRYGKYQAASKERNKKFAIHENSINQCRTKSELRYVSNNSLKEGKNYKYDHNGFLTCKKKSINSNVSIMSVTNAVNTYGNRKKYNNTTYNKTQSIHSLARKTGFQQFQNKKKLNKYQLKIIKILTSSNNGIIYKNNKQDQTNPQIFQSQLQDSFQRESAHFKTIEYSLGRRIKTMVSQNRSRKIIKRKRYKDKFQNQEENEDLLSPSPSQLENQLTRKFSKRLQNYSSISKFTNGQIYQTSQQNSQILRPYLTSTLKNK